MNLPVLPFPEGPCPWIVRPHGEDDEPLYPGTCRSAPGTGTFDCDDGAASWRFCVPDGEAITFMNGRMGPQSFVAGRDFGDFLVWRRDGVPAYQLAVVVDDAAMAITKAVRGADLLKSTARQILLNRARIRRSCLVPL